MKPLKPKVKVPGKNRFRVGRGFSLGELCKAGVTLEKARKLGVYVDKRRRSIREENVEALNKYLREILES